MSGTLTLIAGVLQLIVPSYAFRLVRRFGAERVGWFVVISFASLALLHLMGPMRPTTPGTVSGLDVIIAVGSVLLLIGMGHTETVCKERDEKLRREAQLRDQWTAQTREEIASLTRTNEQLVQELARREQNVKALEAAAARYRLLFTENPRPMWILDLRSCRFLEANQAALRQYGFTAEEFGALTGRDIVLPRSAAAFLQDVCRPCPGIESRGVWQHCRKDGSLIDVEITALDVTYGEFAARLFVAENITERLEQEKAHRNTQKLEAVGRVAAGIAQHFGNIHTLIQNYASALLDRSRDAGSVGQLVQISSAVTRANGLTRQLLSAGAQRNIKLESVDLTNVIRTMTPMLRRLVGKKIVLECSHGENLPPVLADRRQLDHVIVNLVLNARDAMPDGGSLVINTAVGSDSPNSREAGEFICLSISDTGTGMSPEVQSRVFEPFFTTKDRTGHMGLGLASACGIVRQHSGWMEFASEAGAGTEFRVYLPCVPVPAKTEKDGKAAPTIKGTILLVEAEDRPRALARCTLNWNGYRVIEADSSALALLLWERQASHIDLVLTNSAFSDGLSGHELVDRLREAKPGLRAIFTADADKTPNAATLKNARCLARPYAPEKLIEEVRSTLNHTA